MKLKRFFDELTEGTPPHGDRPFQIAHIDHAELDVELVCSMTGEALGRPWASFLTDAFSRRLLAVYLTFDPPCVHSCMMIFRECVRQHRRLPEMIVIDMEREVENVYLETFLARYGIKAKRRPPNRFHRAPVCERLFGVNNMSFVDEVTTDYIINKKHPSQKNGPAWTLEALNQCMCEWAYTIYDNLDHPVLGRSPWEAVVEAESRIRADPRISYAEEEEFEMLTLPTTSKGTARISRARGVKINYLYYWSEWFRGDDMEGKEVSVRYDPYDSGHTYAHLDSFWADCISDYYSEFHGRSCVELTIAAEALRRRNQGSGNRLVITRDRLLNFILSDEGVELTARRRQLDWEIRQAMKKVEIPYIRLAAYGPFEEEEEAEHPIEFEDYGRY